MEEISIIYAAVIGLITGSFLNVVIYRLPLEQSVVKPRSACPACGNTLKFYENIPVLSYIIQRAKCRNCSAPISIQYPLIELATGAIFVSSVIYLKDFPLHYSAAAAIFVTILLALAIIDYRHMILPDEMTIGGGVAFLLYSFINPVTGPLDAFIAAISGAVGFMAILIFYLKIRKIEGLGWGDVKMMLLLGGFLGIEKMIVTIMAASFSGLLAGLIIMVVKRQNLQMKLPFGTFLSLGAFIAMIYGDKILLFLQQLYSIH